MATSSTADALQPPSNKFVVIKQLSGLVWVVIPRKCIPGTLDRSDLSDSHVAMLRSSTSVLKMSKTPHPIQNEALTLEKFSIIRGSEEYIVPLVEAYDVESDLAKSWIQLPVVTGVTLQKIGRLLGDASTRDVVTREDLLYILSKVCDAVIFSHKNKLVHGLLTPDNVLLAKTATGVLPQVTFIDFVLSGNLENEKDGQAEGKQMSQLFGYLLSLYETETRTRFEAPDMNRDTVQAVLDVFRDSVKRDDSEFAMQHMSNKWRRDFKADHKISAGLQKWMEDNIPDKLVTDNEIRGALAQSNSNV